MESVTVFIVKMAKGEGFRARIVPDIHESFSMVSGIFDTKKKLKKKVTKTFKAISKHLGISVTISWKKPEKEGVGQPKPIKPKKKTASLEALHGNLANVTIGQCPHCLQNMATCACREG